MRSSLTNIELEVLALKLKSGEYGGVDVMRAWIAIDELLYLRGKECMEVPCG